MFQLFNYNVIVRYYLSKISTVELSLNLSFTITKSENLTLSIYDLKGVLVQNKVLGKLPEGEQLMQISADDLISGTYIVSLNSSTEIIGTNRLVIIK